jgi:hypothetical protein
MPGLRGEGEYTLKIVPSGYEFLGPGNQINYNVPRNYNDAVAKEHDIAYGELQRKGINPYVTFTSADEQFLEKLAPNDIASIFARYVFEGKRGLANLGLLERGTSLSILQWDRYTGDHPDRLNTSTEDTSVWKEMIHEYLTIHVGAT